VGESLGKYKYTDIQIPEMDVKIQENRALYKSYFEKR
jgi:hypothetical protein